jgi:GH24 family phage-related lysozyme (muramidase)
VTNQIRLLDLFRYYRQLPHQSASISELEEALLKADPALLNRDQPWFKTWSTGGKQQDTSSAIKLIQEFEGCHLEAYLCPAGIPTIGWGNTRHVDGRPVKLGDKITSIEADMMLRREVDRIIEKLRVIPHWNEMSAGQQSALISFGYNLGASFYGAQGFETITKRLQEKDWAKMPDALLLYRNPGSSFEAGLKRRREAEGRLWLQGLGLQFTPSSPFNTKITPHITYGELCLNEERRRFVNQAQCDIATELCSFLEKARAQFGDKPLIITSGHRPQAVNQAVGGASNSEHLYKPGCGAVDWCISGVPVQTVQNWCVKNWPYSTGLGAPKGFIHTGIRAGRPRVVWDY